ncbi:MAG: GntR family transcriptional regulator [Eubacteriales bacterium]|nr:GntR family transcriptional regulator [Eubacteriales bacterium]
MQLLSPTPTETMRDYSLRVLKQNIISLDMQPGKMYSEKELASTLGLSRTPMREALLQLSKIKIVDIYPQRGSAVSLIDYDLVDEARFIREALECSIVKLVCQIVTPEQLMLLQSNVSRQQKYLQSGNIAPLLPLDNNFHKLLYQIANKMQSYDFVSSMTIHLDRVRNMALSTSTDHGFVAEHQAILDAICKRDGDLAAELVHKHVVRFRIDEQDIRKRYPSYIKH